MQTDADSKKRGKRHDASARAVSREPRPATGTQNGSISGLIKIIGVRRGVSKRNEVCRRPLARPFQGWFRRFWKGGPG
jgi:hypothetical protein